MVMHGLVLDHLVVAARTLGDGVAWCEATLGVVPAHGGRHAFMATHNRVLSIATHAWPLAYLEIIAIDPDATAPGRSRWFALDTFDAAPRLVQWVARCEAGIEHARAAMIAAGRGDPGRVTDAARDDLRWRITLREDGAIVAPALIEWQGRHPGQTLPPSGVELISFSPDPAMTARVRTPRGIIAL